MNAYDIVTTLDGWRTVEPKPGEDELKRFYAEKYYQEEHGTYSAAISDIERRYRLLQSNVLLKAVEDCRGAPKPGTRFLDVGCGQGFLLRTARQAGYDVCGYDFSRYAVETFNPEVAPFVRHGDVIALLEEAITSQDLADVCALEHVLEHVRDPEALLERLSGALKPGGVVAVSVPNDFSDIQTAALNQGHIDGPFWLAPPEHLNYFNAENLQTLFRRKGFDVLAVYGDLPIDWYLFHPGSNYAVDKTQGKAAHKARVQLSLALADKGMEAYYALLKSFARCGAGRSVTVVAAVNSRGAD